MPEIAVAANTAAVASAASMTPGTVGSAAADGQNAGVFAALLEQQLTGTTGTTVSALAAILGAAENPSPTAGANQQAADPAALLPMLTVGTGTTTAGTESDLSARPGRKANRPDDPVAATDGIIAAPATIIPAIAAQTQDTATGTATAIPSPAAAAAANLAAAAAADAPAAPMTKQEAAALLAEGADVRTAGLPAAPGHIAPVATAQAEAASRSVDTPVGNRGWDAEVGNHLVWMSGSQTSRAELVLTPPQMGKIEISLTMSGDHATASFVSANPEVRAAIQDAMPRLREILADAGVTLGQTQVGAESSRQWTGNGENTDNSFRGSAVALGGGGLHGSTGGSAAWTATGRGLVDVFA